MVLAINMTGKTVGHWTVLGVAPSLNGMKAFHCRCTCGNERVIRGATLRSGKSTNCGCIQRIKTGDRARIHGKCHHHLYRTWTAMRDRCNRPSHHAFHNYGGRGIKVCPRWTDFSNFLEDMEDTWEPGLTLDRTNNDGDYSPENCRWASSKIQRRNTRQNRVITFNGTSMPLVCWAEKIGITPNALRLRLAKGWHLERALTTPAK